MYKIIGVDQKEYGPLPADQIRQWIGEGRLNNQTMAQAEGSDEWKTLSEFSEFSEFGAALAAWAAMSPPPVQMAKAEALATQILARDYHLDIGSCFSRGWQLVRRHFWLTVGACFVIALISLVIELIPILGWFAGLVFAHQRYVSFGQMIFDLELIAKATEADYWRSRVEQLPL